MQGVFSLREEPIRTILTGMKTFLPLLLLIMLPSLGQGAMYKWTSDEGEVIYSDTPPSEGAEEIKLPALTTTPAVKYKPKPEPLAAPDTKITRYTEFKLIDPVNDAIIRDNTGNVPVNLSLKPDLDTQSGHGVNILIDGIVKISNSQQTTALIPNVDRGTHTLSAEIRDRKGKVLKASNRVDFTILRHSTLHKKPPPPPPPPAN